MLDGYESFSLIRFFFFFFFVTRRLPCSANYEAGDNSVSVNELLMNCRE